MSEPSRSIARPAITVSTKAEAAYLTLRERILVGALLPGATINQERLATDLGLSITPLREALRRLEAEGLVTLSAHKIVSVAPLTWQELHELCVTREQLDPFAATLAAEAATDAQTAAIEALARGDRPGDLPGRLTAHRDFHLAIYAASQNTVLAGILRQLWDRTDRYRLIVLRDRDYDHGAGAEHMEIARAIRARDGVAAAGLVRHHVREALRSIEKIARGEPDGGQGEIVILDEDRPGSLPAPGSARAGVERRAGKRVVPV